MQRAIIWVVDQFKFHGAFAARAEKRVASEAFKEELLEGLPRQDAEAFGSGGYFCGEHCGDPGTVVLVADVAVESVVADALKAFREDMLNHAPDKAKDGQGFIFDLSGFVIPVPVLHVLPVVALDAPH